MLLPRMQVAPAEGIELFVLDDEGVLFSESEQELYRLNLPATWIWCALEAGQLPDEVAGAFARAFDLPAEVARERVDDLLERWRRLGWLVPAAERACALPLVPRSPAHRRGTWELREAEAPLEVAEPAKADGRHYQLLATRVRLACTSAALEQWLHPILAHLEQPADRSADVTLTVREEADEQGYALLLDGEEVERCERLEQVAPLVKEHLRLLAINAEDYFLQLHAGSVSDGESCTLFPGAPGSGKSTLVAALIRAGFVYLSDEVTLLDPDSLRARALPLALTLKPGSLAPLSGDWPEVASLPSHLREDDQIVRYLAPPREALLPDPNCSLPVRAIVFPRYRPDEPTRLRPLPRAEALARLLDECLSLPYALDRARVARLVDWLRGVACAELGTASLSEAVKQVRALQF